MQVSPSVGMAAAEADEPSAPEAAPYTRAKTEGASVEPAEESLLLRSGGGLSCGCGVAAFLKEELRRVRDAGRAVDMKKLYMPYWVARFTDHVDTS